VELIELELTHFVAGCEHFLEKQRKEEIAAAEKAAAGGEKGSPEKGKNINSNTITGNKDINIKDGKGDLMKDSKGDNQNIHESSVSTNVNDRDMRKVGKSIKEGAHRHEKEHSNSKSNSSVCSRTKEEGLEDGEEEEQEDELRAHGERFQISSEQSNEESDQESKQTDNTRITRINNTSSHSENANSMQVEGTHCAPGGESDEERHSDSNGNGNPFSSASENYGSHGSPDLTYNSRKSSDNGNGNPFAVDSGSGTGTARKAGRKTGSSQNSRQDLSRHHSAQHSRAHSRQHSRERSRQRNRQNRRERTVGSQREWDFDRDHTDFDRDQADRDQKRRADAFRRALDADAGRNVGRDMKNYRDMQDRGIDRGRRSGGHDTHRSGGHRSAPRGRGRPAPAAGKSILEMAMNELNESDDDPLDSDDHPLDSDPRGSDLHDSDPLLNSRLGDYDERNHSSRNSRLDSSLHSVRSSSLERNRSSLDRNNRRGSRRLGEYELDDLDDYSHAGDVDHRIPERGILERRNNLY
jgi:hypothetical protein